MTDIVIAPANVIAQPGASINRGTAGATIVAGQMVYRDDVNGTYKLADADSVTQDVQETVGMALNGAADNQPLAVLEYGDVALGAVLTAGARYYLSSTPGGVAPETDLSTGEEINLIGLARSTSILAVQITRPGVTV